MPKWQRLVKQVRFGGDELLEGEVRVLPDADVYDSQPEAGHGVVIAVSAPMVRCKALDRRDDGVGSFS